MLGGEVDERARIPALALLAELSKPACLHCAGPGRDGMCMICASVDMDRTVVCARLVVWMSSWFQRTGQTTSEGHAAAD